MDKKKTAYQDIVDKIHYYINNPHKNPYDVFDYEGDEVIIDSNGDQVTGNNLNKKNWYYNKNN